MKPVRYTLLSEGTSDRALLPIITWALRTAGCGPIQQAWADLGRLRNPPRSLHTRIAKACELYPCDLLFVHRDADNAGQAARENEINDAARTAFDFGTTLITVPVVPTRCMETWLLIDESAIRAAAGNPNGTQQLLLPSLVKLEEISDPKDKLNTILREASGLHGRQLKKFCCSEAIQSIPEYMSTFNGLRMLASYLVFERHVQVAVERIRQ